MRPVLKAFMKIKAPDCGPQAMDLTGYEQPVELLMTKGIWSYEDTMEGSALALQDCFDHVDSGQHLRDRFCDAGHI